ncbi:MAG TPA: hypothetical protein VHB21_24235 [Minicystis sp.]|nr:hypothetical protein [Minicystis sp.]
MAGTNGAFAVRHEGAWQELGGVFGLQPPNHEAVAANGPDDVWVGGGDLEHWDGHAWSVVAPFDGSSSGRHIVDLWAQGDALWAVEVDDVAGTSRVYRRTGESFTEVVERYGLHAVWGSGPDDVWIAGAPALKSDGGDVGHWANSIYHYDGATLTEIPVEVLPVAGAYGPPTFERIHGTGPDDVLFVGSLGIEQGGASGSVALVYAFDGQGFTPYTTPFDVSDLSLPDRFDCAYATSPTDVWLCAGRAMYHFDGATFARTELTSYETYLQGIHALGPDDVTVVGGQRIAGGPLTGAAYHFDGASWTGLATGAGPALQGIWTFPGGEAWAVGESTTLLHRR